MSKDRPHSRSGPDSAFGARSGAGGLRPDAAGGGLAEAAARAAAAAAPAPGTDQPGTPPGAAPGEPLPLEPGREYVDRTDHEKVVDQLTRERDEMRGDLQRVAADFENYKRRAAREREQAAAATESKLLGELLTVIDDMERALEHAAQAEETHPKLAEGVRMVHGRLEGVVQSHGLERVPTQGLFDPNLHDAMMVQKPADPSVPDDTILQVLQSGWRLGDRVLRHARVIVAGGG